MILALSESVRNLITVESFLLFIADGKYGDKEPFTFEDIFNSTFQPKSFDVKWIVGTGKLQCNTLSLVYALQCNNYIRALSTR
jgi:hypothetical protein